MNRENLEKLASYLESLPADYKHFGMRTFLSQDGYGYSYSDRAPIAGECGTVACAVGHGPAAGIPPTHEGQDWHAYSDRVFQLELSEWSWCFDGMWARIDNTHLGAAKRIRYMLEHGVPENSACQRWGEEPYMFAQETEA